MTLPTHAVPQFRPLKGDFSKVPWPKRWHLVREYLNVERSERYRPGFRVEDGGVFKPSKGVTWCNVYVTDFIALMGVEAPRHWMTSKGEPAALGKGVEHRANELLDWFGAHGPRYGWASADSQSAQAAAERGHLVVVGWRNPKRPEPGHIAIVKGRDRITQAGKTNQFECTVRMGFGDAQPLEWYIQMDRPGGHNS
jgi:hypothetical protein